MRASLTRWTDIGRARAGDAATWERLVAKYRPPVIAFIAGQGLRAEAEDIAQEVFLTLFDEGVLQRADPAQGRFRALLQAVTRNVVRRHLAHRGAQKRGGGAEIAPLLPDDEPAAAEDDAFDREWALNLLDLALDRLARDHPRYFAAVEGFFLEQQPQAQVAAAMQVTPKDVKNLVFRGKKKLLQLLREEAWHTCASPEEYADELDRLRRFLRA